MSSYRGPFHNLSPSDQADMRSWTEPPEPECDLCNAPFVLPREIAAQDEITGLLVCETCIEAELQAAVYQ